jgi:hypothetical protein
MRRDRTVAVSGHELTGGEYMPTNAVPDVPVPDRLKQRPFDDRGFLIPWFVDYVDGKPDFRTMDPRKFTRAVTERRCWTCGDVMGVHKVFVIGPMCAVNRTAPEPPSHRECAIYSVMACPFMSKPHAQRRTSNLPDDARDAPGLGLMRNPKVSMLWTTPEYTIFAAGAGTPGYLIRIGKPTKVEFFRERREATVEEIRESVQTGLPHLDALAQLEGVLALKEYRKTLAEAARYFPAGVF